MSVTLSAMKEMYDTFTNKLDMMLAAAKTQADRDQITAQYTKLEKEYDLCVNKTFHDNDAAALALVKQAKDVTASLKKIENDLGTIAKVIGYATQAAKVGAGIATLV